MLPGDSTHYHHTKPNKKTLSVNGFLERERTSLVLIECMIRERDMVSLGKEREEESVAVERSKPLHNFNLPWLKWGNRRVMRCMKVDDDSNTDVSASVPDRRRPNGFIGRVRDSELKRRGSTDRRREVFKFSTSSPAPAAEVGGSGRKSRQTDDGIEAVREKLMSDLQTEADKLKFAIFRRRLADEKVPATVAMSSPSVDDDALRPWNLRTRRAACKQPPADRITSNGNGGRSLQVDVRKPKFSPLRNEAIKSPRILRGSVVAAGGGGSSAGEKRERAKFSVKLSRQEIEEDFMAMAGHKLPRRPKKRPKIVQKQLDTLFPGLWMTEIEADFYKVPDATENGKR